ncbi:hypothetical protein Q5P01_005385, partial [Channa striata]
MTNCWEICSDQHLLSEERGTVTYKSGSTSTQVDYRIIKYSVPLMAYWPCHSVRQYAAQLVCTCFKQSGAESFWARSFPRLGPAELLPHLGFCEGQYEVTGERAEGHAEGC